MVADIKWIKLSTGLFDNKKIRIISKMPEGDSIIVVWLQILCLAGVTNDEGSIYITKDIPYTEETLSISFDRPLSVIKLALKTFESFGMIEVVDNFLRVSNWEKYQNIEGMEKIREQTRLRVQKYREQKRLESQCNATVTQSNETDKNKNRIRIDKDKEKDKRLKEKNIKKEVVTLKSLIQDFSPNEEVELALNAYVELRQKKRNPLTVYALKLGLNKLRKMTNSPSEWVEIINQAIEKGWLSFYPLKDNVSVKNENAFTNIGKAIEKGVYDI